MNRSEGRTGKQKAPAAGCPTSGNGLYFDDTAVGSLPPPPGERLVPIKYLMPFF